MCTIDKPEFKFGDKVEVRDASFEEWLPAIFIKNGQYIDGGRFKCFVKESDMPTTWVYCRYADG